MRPVSARLACTCRRRRLYGWLALVAGGAEEALLQERQLLLELCEFQLQSRLSVLALEPGILLHNNSSLWCRRAFSASSSAAICFAVSKSVTCSRRTTLTR